MAQDERLREALLELQTLRQREADALRESRALLDLLAALGAATSLNDAYGVLRRQIAQVFDADVFMILTPEGSGLTATSAQPVSLEGTVFPGLQPLRTKPRTFVSRSKAPIWTSLVAAELDGMESLISAPLQINEDIAGVAMALSQRRAAFSKAEGQLLARICALASTTLQSLELQERNALLAAVIDGSSSGFAIADARQDERPLIFVNAAFESLSEFSADEVLGRNCRFLNAEPADSVERLRLRSAVAGDGRGTFLLRNKTKSGRQFWNELTLYPVTGPDGKNDYLVATQVDATDRVTAQAESRRLARDLDDALAHTQDAFLLLDQDLGVAFANAQTRSLFPAEGSDWQRGTAFAENWANFVQSLTGEAFANDAIQNPDLRALSKLPSGQELHMPDGRVLMIRVQDTDAGGLVVSATDITALKTSERLLRQRVTAIENAPDGIGIVEEGGRILHANSRLGLLLGARDADGVVGRKWHRGYTEQEPGSIQRALSKVERGTPVKGLQLKRDDAVHEVSITPSGTAGTVLIVRDISDLVAIRQRRSELASQLEQARRQQAVAELSAGIAHDFNNLLSAINGSAHLISGQDELSEQTRAHADRILQAGDQAARLVNRLLDIGGADDAETEFDLGAVLHDAADLARTNLAETAHLDVVLPSDAIVVTGHPVEASQIVINLLLNAGHALQGQEGVITLDLREMAENAAPETVVGHLRPGRRYAQIKVSDTGTGMDQATKNRIFEAYFTTKGDQGTGVGLATVGTLVTRLGGAISLQSTLGQGTTFRIFWPIDGAETRDTVIGEGDTAALNGALILLVDDEPQVMEVLANYLETFGAEVSCLSDPELAIEVLTEDPEAWSAVVSDYAMGALTGGDLVAAVRDVTPRLPIFIATALSKRLSDPRIHEGTVQAVFAKPIDLRQASLNIARAISEQGADI